MQTLTKNAGMLATLVILIVGFIAYRAFVGTPLAPQSTAAASNHDLVILAEKLSAISFDRSFINTPGYRSLVDFSAILEEQEAGRTNPFNPIGRD